MTTHRPTRTVIYRTPNTGLFRYAVYTIPETWDGKEWDTPSLPTIDGTPKIERGYHPTTTLLGARFTAWRLNRHPPRRATRIQ